MYLLYTCKDVGISLVEAIVVDRTKKNVISATREAADLVVDICGRRQHY